VEVAALWLQTLAPMADASVAAAALPQRTNSLGDPEPAEQRDQATGSTRDFQPAQHLEHSSPAREAAVRQPAAAGAAASAPGDSSPGDADDADPAEDVKACLFSLLQRKCPELKITCNALGMLEGLLDQVGLQPLTTLTPSSMLQRKMMQC